MKDDGLIREPGSGAIMRNGHRPISPVLRSVILDLLKVRGRTTAELASCLRYSAGHIRQTMRGLVADGDVIQLGRVGQCVAWLLPDDEVNKICTTCRVPKPHSQFGRDSSTPDGLVYSCKLCRAEYAAARAAGLDIPARPKGPAPKPVLESQVLVVPTLAELREALSQGSASGRGGR